MKIATATILLVISVPVTANTPDISFNWLKSTSGQNSALSGNCSENSNGTLSCSLRQIGVRLKVSNDEYLSNLKKSSEDIRNTLETTSAQEFVERDFGEVCKGITEFSGEVDIVALQLVTDMCDNPSESSISQVIEYFMKVEAQTCKVYEIDVGSYTFERVNNSKWVSANNPTGACGAVTVLTLEHEKEHESLWTYKQVRHYTNTETQVCQQMADINEPISYSWKGKSPIELNCKYIEFGF